MKKISIFITFLVTIGFSQLGMTQVFFGMKFDIVASDPAGVVAAMDKFSESQAAQAAPGNVTLHQYLVNGENPATHAFVVTYPSAEAMDATNARNAISQDWATFLTELNMVSQQAGTMMFRSLGLNTGDPDSITSPNAAGNWIFMNVSDPETYAEAWQELVADGNDLPITSTLIQVVADGTGGITHALIQSSNSMATMLNNPAQANRGWDDFIDEVEDIRTIENRVMTVSLKQWSAD
tara:strand:+ start:1045 stop:1755 length:711 start_codon:yes stop_codon:yes gene_type:complete